jgi:proteasome assembly chaperone (PAC2) family protein
MRTEDVISEPRILCSATDRETLQSAIKIGGEIMRGNIYGAAGLLVGLAGVRGMRGLSILAETAGQLVDVVAAKTALEFLGRYLGLQVDLSRLDRAAEANRKLLEAFLHAQPKENAWPDMRI